MTLWDLNLTLIFKLGKTGPENTLTYSQRKQGRALHLSWPLSFEHAINRPFHDYFAVTGPEYLQFATRQLYGHFVIYQAMETGCNDYCTGSGATRQRDTRTSLPHADPDSVTIKDIDDLKVHALWEHLVALHLRPNLSQWKVFYWVLEEHDGVRISH